MTSTRVVVSAALVFATVLTAQALVPQGPPAAPQAPSGRRSACRRARSGSAGAPARAGAAAAAMRQRRCTPSAAPAATASTCPVAARRACSTTSWAHGSDDESIARTITNGVPNTEMQPFKEQLTEVQIWQLVAYLKTQAGNLKDKPVYVPDPDGQVIKTEKQSFKIEIVARGLETPWGLAFLPDGRLLITERPAGCESCRKASCCRSRSPARRRSGSGRTAACSTSRSTRSTRRTAGSTWPTPSRARTTRRRPRWRLRRRQACCRSVAGRRRCTRRRAVRVQRLVRARRPAQARRRPEPGPIRRPVPRPRPPRRRRTSRTPSSCAARSTRRTSGWSSR